MSQRIRTKAKKKRGFTYLWIFGLALLVFLLIYFEQTALLYIFSTLGVTVLLIIVALADLGRSELSSSGPEQVSGAPAPAKSTR
jgi:hypothetical protein